MKKRENRQDLELAELRDLLAFEGKGKNQHLDSDLGARRYLNNADKIATYLPHGKILDWGCGLGQMTHLLKKRGLDVVSYDVERAGHGFLARIGQSLILADDQAKLPFPDASFDAVLSSGVLEHVPDPAASLEEIARITKKDGYFFIFRLPNKYSYIEFISDRLGRGDHPVKYTRREIKASLERTGYDVLYDGYYGFLPYNLKGFPEAIRSFYHRFDLLWEKIDALLTALPGLNWFCTNIELVARKKGNR